MRRMYLLLACCTLLWSSGPRWAVAVDLFVNNVAGNARFRGTQQRSGSGDGPCLSISQALRLARRGDRIVIANTGRPYRECLSVQAGPNSGLADQPLTLEGNGAVIDGSLPVPAEAWQHYRGDVHRFQPRKMSHQMLFLDDRPAERVPVENSLLAPFPQLKPMQWCLFQGRVYFCCQPGRSPTDYLLTHSALLTGITLYEVEHVVVKDLVVQGFVFDGVNAHNSVLGAELVGLTARGNGRSGISIGGGSRVRVNSCLLGANGESQLRLRGYSRVRVSNSRLLPEPFAPAIDRQGGGWLDYEPLAEEARRTTPDALPYAAATRR